MAKLNEHLWDTHPQYRVCVLCGNDVRGEINIEGIIHFGASLAECIDRRACRKRKKKK